jgi:phospholipid/cholesterol/gamma-HCH transport system substrate-binding protein
MIKKAPSPAAIAAIVLFTLSCFGVLLYLWITFGGSTPLRPKGYRVYVRFPEAVQLADEADVRIAGVPVGKVVKIQPDPGDDRTRATLELKRQFAPLPRDTHAMLRLKSLLGETYVELSPGHRGRGVLPDGGTLPDSAVSHTVELDEILRTFDPDTRRAFQTWMQSQAAAVKGRGADINAAFGNLPGFVGSGTNLLETLDAQSAAVRKLIATTGEVFADISARDGDLSGLIAGSNRLFQTTAQRNRDLAAVFQRLPRFELESRLTLPRLTQFARRARPVVRQLQPVATEFQPTFAALDRLSPELKGLFSRLGPVVTASQRGLPAFDRILTQLPPLLDQFQPFLRDANPIVDFIGKDKRSVTAFFANITAASLGRDNGLQRAPDRSVHYLRTGQTLSPLGLAFYPHPPGQTRANAYLAPGALDRLAAGLPVLDSEICRNGDPAPPTDADPPQLQPLVQLYAFRTSGRDVARPACTAQGNYPGFGTAFPQLRAEP